MTKYISNLFESLVQFHIVEIKNCIHIITKIIKCHQNYVPNLSQFVMIKNSLKT